MDIQNSVTLQKLMEDEEEDTGDRCEVAQLKEMVNENDWDKGIEFIWVKDFYDYVREEYSFIPDEYLEEEVQERVKDYLIVPYKNKLYYYRG